MGHRSPAAASSAAIVVAFALPAAAETPPNYVAGSLVQLNDNGAWSWFMDERVIVADGKLVVGSVRSLGDREENLGRPNSGNVEIAVYDIATGEVASTTLHKELEQDDHDVPALMRLPDGRILAVYSKHARERKVYYRFSEPGDPLKWSEAQVFETPGGEKEYAGDNVTYSNLFRMPDGRLYDFHRGFSHDPNYLYSDDDGETWTYGGRLMRGRDGYSPYLKYAYDGRGVIHFVATEDHPRNFDNSLYHGFLRDGVIHHSDGRPIAPLGRSQEAPLATWDMTRIFQGDPDNVAWMVDVELDDQDRPHVVFSVQKDGRELPPRQGGMDLRYHHARWDGSEWIQNEIAHAGTRLYPYEDDYSGLAALHPNDPAATIVISTDAHPVTGRPLISPADGKRHYELYLGRSDDAGATWRWRALTANSTVDNLRPLIPKWDDERTALVWMRGPAYIHNNGDWSTGVAAMILPPEALAP